MKAKGSPNSSQLGSKTGHSGGGSNSSGRGWLIVSDRPGGGSDRTGHCFSQRKKSVEVMRFTWSVFFFLFLVFLKKPRLFTVRLGGSQSTSTPEEATHIHTHTYAQSRTHVHTLTHTYTHSEENVPRQWARPLKKLDTTQFLLMPVCLISLHNVCSLNRLLNKQLELNVDSIFASVII